MPHGDVDTDDRAHAQAPHDVSGKKVEEAAIHQQVAIDRDGRVISGQTGRGQEPFVQGPVFVHEALGAREIRRYAKILDPQIFNLRVGGEHLDDGGSAPSIQ